MLLPFQLLTIPCFWTCTTEAFVVLDSNTQCGQDTLLATLEECRSAKTILDPRAAARRVKTETNANAPRGCSRYEDGLGLGLGLGRVRTKGCSGYAEGLWPEVSG